MAAISRSPKKKSICAIIITCNPSTPFNQRLPALLDQVQEIIIIDNGSESAFVTQLKNHAADQHIRVIYNNRNLGIARALNMSIKEAIGQGYPWVLTLDQDSQPHPDMVAELCSSYQRAPRKENIAIIAPQIIDSGLGRSAPFLRQRSRWRYERTPCLGDDLENVTTVISSGALINADIFETVGGFREDFFIDYVDTEYCLRALSMGYEIRAACPAKLDHRLGDRRRANIGPFALLPTFHPPDRWYTMARNRIPMIRKYAARFPHWLMYEIVASLYTLLRMLLTEDQRRKKVSAILKGSRDGLRNRLGTPPWAHSQQSLPSDSHTHVHNEKT
jgi:rhamnosyltransferase